MALRALSRFVSRSGEGVRGAHVPTAWPLSERYNGSVDPSEESALIVPWERAATREPRVRAREKPSRPSGSVQYSGSLDRCLARTHVATTRIKPVFCYLGTHKYILLAFSPAAIRSIGHIYGLVWEG